MLPDMVGVEEQGNQWGYTSVSKGRRSGRQPSISGGKTHMYHRDHWETEVEKVMEACSVLYTRLVTTWKAGAELSSQLHRGQKRGHSRHS